MAKLSEILLNNATGTNSVVLNTKAANDRIITLIHAVLRLTSLTLLGVVIFIIV